MDQMFHYEWVTVHGAETLILKVPPVFEEETEYSGKSTEISPAGNGISLESDTLILIIPGNPGTIQYYQDFAVALWENLGCRIPVWGVSHAGHVLHSKIHREQFGASSFPQLQFQIDHKCSFIKNHIPSVTRIILIGHSIGTYISLKVADVLPDSLVIRVIGLFPAIERMALTPQGKIFVTASNYGRWLIFATAYGLSLLPDRFHRWILSRFLADSAEHHYQGGLNLMSYRVFLNCYLMAEEEMEKVIELDRDLFKKLLSKICLYYGQNDHWCPVQFHHDIKQLFPNADVHLCHKGFEHAFVVRDSFSVAEIVSAWIK